MFLNFDKKNQHKLFHFDNNKSTQVYFIPWTVISTSFQLGIHEVCLKGFSIWKTKVNVKVYATYFALFKFWLTEIPLKRVNFKKEMYNTMNSYHKYTSIPKSSFNQINILILPINTGETFLKYFTHYACICDYQPLWI